MLAQANARSLSLFATIALLAATIAALIAANPAEAKHKRSAGKAVIGRAVTVDHRRPVHRSTKPTPVHVGESQPIWSPPTSTQSTAPAPAPAPTPPPPPTTSTTPPRPTTGTLLEAGFEEDNLNNWNIAGVGEVIPTVTNTVARTGSYSGRFVLTGNQNRSELILGGNGSGSATGTEEFFEGAEYWYGFSFYINQMVYGGPGAHNLFFQFKSNGTGSPAFGLDLWNYLGHKGIWVEGSATGGPNRYVAPAAEHAWHDVQLHFKASETGNGFYELFVDGQLVDARTGTSMIVPGKDGAYIKNGLYRNGQTAPGYSELFIDSAKLGTTQASVLP